MLFKKFKILHVNKYKNTAAAFAIGIEYLNKLEIETCKF